MITIDVKKDIKMKILTALSKLDNMREMASSTDEKLHQIAIYGA